MNVLQQPMEASIVHDAGSQSGLTMDDVTVMKREHTGNGIVQM